MEKETIAAIATPFGSGGIGIIRISGAEAAAIAEQLFSRSVSTATDKVSDTDNILQSHHLTHGYIVDGQRVIDEVMTVFMQAPHSYTAEDVVEIQSHSGPIVLNQILQLVIRCGARLAEPGEFTRRAYLNGRIDLSQAEAVADIITAKSDQALEVGTTQLMGALKDEINGIVTHLDAILAEFQARLEFSEEIEDDMDHPAIFEQLSSSVLKPTQNLVAQYHSGHVLRDGIRMDIVGRPNVGKSSLLNRLLLKDKAIVTNLPGTTRDLIEDCFSIKGIPIIVTDTAGLHATENPIEKIGIQKTHDNIARSDLVLFVVDGAQPFQDGDMEIYHSIRAKNIILVINKLDLIAEDSVPEIPREFEDAPRVFISALKGDGLEGLKSAVVELCMGGVDIDPGRVIIPNLRQKVALDLAISALERLQETSKNSIDDELIVEDLKMARDALLQVVGKRIEGDMLDQIFERFCIGK